jgi:protein-S-isoprenylcysteine O-methyltransferase Ste14
MSGAGGLDLRYPIGGLFTVLGLLLTVYGLATNGNAEMYARSTGVNVNLWWGVVMIVVGALFLLLAARAGKGTSRPASDSAAGRETESREHTLGLER